MNDPVFYHCPNGIAAKSRRQFRSLARRTLTEMPRRLAPKHTLFVTYNNKEKPMLVERCYELAGIDAVTVAKNFHPWNWMGKIAPLKDYLDAVGPDVQYVVATDANDVLLVGDPASIIERFEQYDCDILFCNTMANWPRNTVYAAFEAKTYSESKYHCHLSAGGYVGRVPAVLCCLNRIVSAWKRRELWACFRSRFDDQHAWRHLHYIMYPRVKVDYRKLVFCRFDHRRKED